MNLKCFCIHFLTQNSFWTNSCLSRKLIFDKNDNFLSKIIFDKKFILDSKSFLTLKFCFEPNHTQLQSWVWHWHSAQFDVLFFIQRTMFYSAVFFQSGQRAIEFDSVTSFLFNVKNWKLSSFWRVKAHLELSSSSIESLIDKNMATKLNLVRWTFCGLV